MRLYHGAGSPHSWPAHLALEHKGVSYDLTTISFHASEHLSPSFLSLNPRHRVPVLVDDDFVLTESNAILEYLEERLPDHPPLLPRDLRARARVRRVLHEITAYVAPSIREVGVEVFRKSPDEWNRGWLMKQRDELGTELRLIAGAIRGPFFEGEVSAADLRLYPVVALIRRFDRRDAALQFEGLVSPELADWMRAVEALPYFATTYPAHWA